MPRGDRDKKAFQGPFLDGAQATGMEVAYVDFRVGSLGRIYKPMPSNAVVNEVLAGNAPEIRLNQALADGSYVPSAKVKATEDAYKAYLAAR